MTIPSWARVGAKVVLVDDSPPEGPKLMPVSMPVLGKTYTIREVIGAGAKHVRNDCILLEEITNPISPVWHEEYCYRLKRFRPLTTTKTQAEDVAMIRSLIKDEVNA